MTSYVPHYVTYSLRPSALQALNAATVVDSTAESSYDLGQSVIPSDDMGHSSTTLSAAVRQLVAAAVPGQVQSGGKFRVVQRALKLPFDVLHPRGADGRFITKGGAVKWRSSSSGLWMRGTVDKINTDGTIDITESNGLKTSRPAKSLYAAQKSIAKLSPANFIMVQGQGGSNAGAFFRDPATGDVWYVKTPPSADHVANEIAANKLYGMAGAAVPEIKVSPDGKKILSKVENSEGWYQLDPAQKDEAREDIRQNFLVDAWLANYDAPRNDNIRVNEDGVPIRVDTGGALRYRARGGVKPKLPADMTAEIAKLRQQSAYRGLTRADEDDAVKRILGIAPDDIRDAIKDAGLNSSVADDLIARRAWLGATYGYQLPETTPAGKAALAARTAVNNGGTNGSNPLGTSNSSSSFANSVPSSPSLAQAVKKRDPTAAVDIAPGSPVWLRKKPTPPAGSAKYPDTWTVDYVSADGQSVGLKTAKGQTVVVPKSDVEALRSNLASVKSKYATDQQPSIGDRVAIDLPAGTDPKTHGGDGVITELFPMYARVKMDNGSSKVVAVKKLHLSRGVEEDGSAKSAISTTTATDTQSKGLYNKPFDNNTYQNDYIKQAETLIRAGNFKLQTFSTDSLIPTQDEAHTKSVGSGRGAKDLGPIVAKINGQLYLLDGHHRAHKSDKIKAQYVDLDAEGLTGKVAKPSTNPKGVPFDLANHDFKASPNPIGYSLTHNSPVAYIGQAVEKDGTTSDRDIIAVLPNKANPKDPIPVRIRADNFRVLTSVGHDALIAPKTSTTTKPKATKVPLEDTFSTLDEAKKAVPAAPITVKYPVANGDTYSLEPGDRLFDLKGDGYYSGWSPGLYLIRNGTAHFLGSNRIGDSRQRRFNTQNANVDVTKDFVYALYRADNRHNAEVTVKTAKKNAASFVKAAKLEHEQRGGDVFDYNKRIDNLKISIPRPAPPGRYGTVNEEVDWPSWLSKNITGVQLNGDDALAVTKNTYGNDVHWSPVFILDKDNNKVYYAGDVDRDSYSYNDHEYRDIRKPSEWIELTPEQRKFYFTVTTDAGQGVNTPLHEDDDLEWNLAPKGSKSDDENSIPPNARIKLDHGDKLLSRATPSGSFYRRHTVPSIVTETNKDADVWLNLQRGDGYGGYGPITRDELNKIQTVDATPIPQKSTADAVADAIDPNAKEPKPGDVLPRHRNPYVASKLTPIQALQYKLPTSRTRLDDGKQDNELLSARLVIPEEAERSNRPGSRARPGFISTSDGTAHKDLLLYEYTKLIGGDAGVVRLNKADFDAYVAKHGSTILYRGLGSSESTHDFRSGTYFAGEGVYGSGSYASDVKDTAHRQYANNIASNVTRFTYRPGTKEAEFATLYDDMIESVVRGSNDRIEQMHAVGLSPSKAQLDQGSSTASQAIIKKIDAGLPVARSTYASVSDKQRQKLKKYAETFAEFYEARGMRLDNVASNSSMYSSGSAVTLEFRSMDPNDGTTYRVTITLPVRSSKAASRGGSHGVGATDNPVVDFKGLPAGKRVKHADESVGHTATSSDAFRSGFSSPREFMRFAAGVDKKFDNDQLFSQQDKKTNAKTEDEANKLIEQTMQNQPELVKMLGATARLEFIQDVGRYALAAGIDRYNVRLGRETYVVVTNRNAMIMSR